MSVKQSARRLLSRFLGITTLVVLTWMQCSCSVVESTRQVAPGYGESKVRSLKSFYVRQAANDDYKLASTISGELRSMGYKASHGTTQKPPGKVDTVVTYTDRWMWDITMYMLSLEIQLRDPGSDSVIASGKTVRTSLARRSQQVMAQETLSKILGKP